MTTLREALARAGYRETTTLRQAMVREGAIRPGRLPDGLSPPLEIPKEKIAVRTDRLAVEDAALQIFLTRTPEEVKALIPEVPASLGAQLRRLLRAREKEAEARDRRKRRRHP